MQGACLCGAVRIAVSGAYVAAVGACHCRLCRTWSGTSFAGFEASAAAVTVTGAVTEFRSSPFATRAFCPVCGSHLWLRNDGPDSDYEFVPGAFPAAAEFPLISEIYVDVAARHARLAGDHATGTRAAYEATNPFVANSLTSEGDA
ncbi:MAG: GFA family protein [Jannaschia sp.]